MNSNSQGNWQDSAYNTLSASYSYGYAGARTDLPAVGYDPVYPGYSAGAQQSAFTTAISTTYDQYPVSAGHSQHTEYNPEYPSYQSISAKPTSYIPVNKSNFSVKNTFESQFKRVENDFLNSVPLRNQAPAKRNLELLNKNSTVEPSSAVVDSEPSTTFVLSNASTTVAGLVPTTAPKKKTKRGGVKHRKKTTVAESTSEDTMAPGKNNRRGGGRGNHFSGRGGVYKQFGVNTGGYGAYYPPSYGAPVPYYGQYPPSWSGMGRPDYESYSYKGNGRGNRGGSRGGRKGPLVATNRSYDIEMKSLTDNDPVLVFNLNTENVFGFHGPSNVFTTQHSFPLVIDNHVYENIDHYYQLRKVQDICGTPCKELLESVRDAHNPTPFAKRSQNSKTFGQLAREQLKSESVEKKTVEDWRNTAGLRIVQEAMMTKLTQSGHLREALKETGNQILVHAFATDSVYGAGTTYNRVLKWIEKQNEKDIKLLKIPLAHPLTDETVKLVPKFADGRNILGVILMQLRHLLNNGQIETVDISSIVQAVKGGDTEMTDLTGQISSNGFAIGGGPVQAKMGIA